MSEAAPLIDVLIPAYNAARTIDSALESIRSQTVRDIRIVVIDDGSTDHTAAIVGEIAAKDPRVELYRRKNGGIIDALNFGLQQCRAQFLARFDSDDLSYPDRFARQVEFLRSNPEFVAVGGGVRHIDEDGQPIGSITNLMSPELSNPIWIPSREPYIIHLFLMVRRADVEAVDR